MARFNSDTQGTVWRKGIAEDFDKERQNGNKDNMRYILRKHAIPSELTDFAEELLSSEENRSGERVFLDTLLLLLSKKRITRNKMLCDLSLGNNSFENWSTRGNTPGIKTLTKIADYFGVSIKYLLAGKEEPKEAAQTGDLTKEEQAFIEAWREADEQHRELAKIALESK